MKTLLALILVVICFGFKQPSLSTNDKPNSAQLKDFYTSMGFDKSISNTMPELYEFGEKEFEASTYEILTKQMHIPKILAKRQASQHAKTIMKTVREQVPSLHLEEASFSVFQTIMMKNFSSKEIEELENFYQKDVKEENLLPRQKALYKRFFKASDEFAKSMTKECIDNRFEPLLRRVSRTADEKLMKANSVR